MQVVLTAGAEANIAAHAGIAKQTHAIRKNFEIFADNPTQFNDLSEGKQVTVYFTCDHSHVGGNSCVSANTGFTIDAHARR